MGCVSVWIGGSQACLLFLHTGTFLSTPSPHPQLQPSLSTTTTPPHFLPPFSFFLLARAAQARVFAFGGFFLSSSVGRITGNTILKKNKTKNEESEERTRKEREKREGWGEARGKWGGGGVRGDTVKERRTSKYIHIRKLCNNVCAQQQKKSTTTTATSNQEKGTQTQADTKYHPLSPPPPHTHTPTLSRPSSHPVPYLYMP